MKRLKNLIFLFILQICACPNDLFAQEASVPIRFGLIADTQYGDCDTYGQRYYRNSLKKLSDCVTDLNDRQVQFTITLGDFTDRNPADLDPVVKELKKLNNPIYNTTGNHDCKGVTDNSVLFGKLGMPAEYYSFKKGNWLFIMLNTNEIDSYSNIKGTWKEKELPVMLDRIKSTKRNNNQDWNGGISSKQLEWLKKQLESAEKNGEKVLIFSHNPFYPATEFTALNDQEVLDTIGNYACVKCVISGHHHAGAFAYYNDIPCITTEGMIETETENAYGIIELTDRELILTGIGRTKSHRIVIR